MDLDLAGLATALTIIMRSEQQSTRDSGIATMDGNGEDEYGETGPGEEHYGDTGNGWTPGQRFRVACLRTRHYGRNGTVLKVSKIRLTVEFDDAGPGYLVEKDRVMHAPPCWAYGVAEQHRTRGKLSTHRACKCFVCC